MDEQKNTGVEETESSGNPAQDEQIEVQENNSAQQEVVNQAPQEEDFPSDVGKQREAFYAMRKRIKELEEQDQQQEEDLDLINIARGTVNQGQQAEYPQQQQSTDMFDTSDPATQAFTNEVQQARNEALRARQEAQKAQAQMEDFEAWQKYPYLRPRSAKTEEEKLFVDDVQKEYIAANIKAVSQGRPKLRLVEVADKVRERFEKIKSQGREQAATETAATLAQKEAATLEAQGTKTQIISQGPSNDEIRRRINMGDSDALAESLKSSDPFLANWPE